NPLSWPEEFKYGRLAQRAANVAQAIRLSKHRSRIADALKKIVERYIGAPGNREAESAEVKSAQEIESDKLPLRGQIEVLRMCIENTAPIVSLLRQIDGLEANRKQYIANRTRLRLIGLAADALEQFAAFESLVFQHVSGLIQTLDRGTKEWLSRIYRPHY